MNCLTVMPSGVVMALLRMQPRLEMEEALAAAASAGTLTNERREAAMLALDTAERPKPNPGHLASRGFAVRRVPVKAN